MRKFGFLFIIVAGLLGCKSDPKQALLEGEIKGLVNDTVYLYAVDGIYEKMDTIYAQSGKFSSTINIDTLTAATLLFNNRTEYPVFIDKGEKIKIKGNLSETLTITGNAANEELSAFMQELDGLGKPSEKAMQEKAEAFIREHHSSLASAYLLNKYFILKEKPDYKKIKELIGVMTGTLLDQASIEKVSKYIEQLEKVEDGKSAPYFNLPNAKGEKISRTSENLRNKYLLLTFWASWCDNDSTALAGLRQLNRTYKKSKDFALLGISLDLDKETWKEAIKRDTLNWEQVCDFSGWNSATAKQYAILTLPTNILVSPSGAIIARDIEGDSLNNKIKEVVKAAEEARKKKRP